jgi:hypothetical protein
LLLDVFCILSSKIARLAVETKETNKAIEAAQPWDGLQERIHLLEERQNIFELLSPPSSRTRVAADPSLSTNSDSAQQATSPATTYLESALSLCENMTNVNIVGSCSLFDEHARFQTLSLSFFGK